MRKYDCTSRDGKDLVAHTLKSKGENVLSDVTVHHGKDLVAHTLKS